MDADASFIRYTTKLGKYWLPIALAAFGMIFFVYGLISLIGSTSSKDEIRFEHQELSPQITKIQVDVEGAVSKPGVYKLGTGSIIQDALIASGGLSNEADREYVSKNINLASKLSDGAKIYIPKLGENAENLVSGSSVSTGLININTASEKELDTLPGIGSVTANKIISGRPYLSVNDLLDKKIVSSKVFTQIKEKITAY